MPRFQLPPHLFACALDGHHVFLDLARDRYFRLPDAEEAAFAALAARGGDGDDGLALSPLLGAGILVPFPQGKPLAVTRHPQPVTSLAETADRPAPARLLDVGEVTILVAASRRAVRHKKLPQALANLRRARAGDSPDPTARDRLVRRFRAARNLVPIEPNCLHDSLALRRFLARRNVAADLVIGVKLHPFGAHCWLQDGTSVLNDALGNALGFQPVLVA